MGDNFGKDQQKLLEYFQFIGQNPDDTILNKFLELCVTYKLDEEYLVDEWVAFSLSNFKNDPSPTLERIKLMERNCLSKETSKRAVIPHSSPESERNTNMDELPAAKTPKSVRNDPVHSFTQHVPCSPASQVEPYSKRQDSGKILMTYGTDTTYNVCTEPIQVKLYGEPETLPSDGMYMYQTMTRKRNCISDMTTYIASCIAKKHQIQLPDRYVKLMPNEWLYGRIVCENFSKLHYSSVMLELPEGDYSRGETLTLNLSQLKDFNLFPGQVVVAEGNIVKETLFVEQLFTDTSKCPGFAFDLPEPLQIIVASGPFTLKNDLNYDPLQDLLNYVLEANPHILILMGPFLDVDNENVANGSMMESFKSFFDELIESIMTPLQNTNITVVLVASHKDVNHHVVYPTMPYSLTQKYKNLVCAPDPCLLDIRGILFGITTADVLFHIGKQELCWPSGLGDRMSRLAQYLLDQLCFYPLYPPEQNNMFIDYTLLQKYGGMKTVPHVLLVPSVFRHFVKNVNGCTVINPEHLVKGYAGGCFARLNVNCKENVEVACEIIRI